LGRKLTRDGGPPPGYQKVVQPVLYYQFAGPLDGGEWVYGLPFGQYEEGQMSAIYHRWSYHVTDADLPPDEGGQWLLCGQPMWLEMEFDQQAIQFDVAQYWTRPWAISYPALNPPAVYSTGECIRFSDDWVLTEQETPPTLTWYARLTHVPAQIAMQYDIEGTCGLPPWHKRRHWIQSGVQSENPALQYQTYTRVCDFYPDPGPPGG